MPLDHISNSLFIGSWQDAAEHRTDLIEQYGITAIVNLAIDHDDAWPAYPGVFYFKVGLIDGPGNPLHHLDIATDMVVRLLQGGEVILVHCISGMSRSAYVSTRALSIVTGKPHQEIYNLMMKQRPRTHGMSPYFKQLLKVV